MAESGQWLTKTRRVLLQETDHRHYSTNHWESQERFMETSEDVTNDRVPQEKSLSS